jgi:hypothetical protein
MSGKAPLCLPACIVMSLSLPVYQTRVSGSEFSQEHRGLIPPRDLPSSPQDPQRGRSRRPFHDGAQVLCRLRLGMNWTWEGRSNGTIVILLQVLVKDWIILDHELSCGRADRCTVRIE